MDHYSESPGTVNVTGMLRTRTT